MRVFLDTNVIVAAFATRGLCADVFRVILAEHNLVTADPVIREVDAVLSKKIGLPRKTISEVLALLKKYRVAAQRRLPLEVSLRDPRTVPSWPPRSLQTPMCSSPATTTSSPNATVFR
ncbi:MAG: PIN domain-containing protein [Nitrospirota bacterium]